MNRVVRNGTFLVAGLLASTLVYASGCSAMPCGARQGQGDKACGLRQRSAACGHACAAKAGKTECGTACRAGVTKEACGAVCQAKAGKAESCAVGQPKTDAAVAESKHGLAEISTDGLKAILASGAATVLDARTGQWDDGRRLPGAKSLSPQASAEEAAAVIPAQDSLVVAYCANPQCPAGAILAKRLQELGYQNILKYAPGIDGWVEAGGSVESAK